MRMPGVFSDDMVLQRGHPITVWGESDRAEPVTVTLNGRDASARPTAGHWEVVLPASSAGGPYQLTVRSGKDTLTLSRVRVGDVWLFAGGLPAKSPVSGSLPPEVVPISYLSIPRRESATPVHLIPGEWRPANAGPAAGMPPDAASFARGLSETEAVPIGIIDAAPGNYRIDAWLSPGTPVSETVERMHAYYRARHRKARADHQRAAEKAAGQGKSLPKFRGRPPTAPHVLYNGMISPLTRVAVCGVVWRQTSADRFHAAYHQRLLSQVVADWREAWEMPELPFLLVQLGAMGKTRPASARPPTQSQYAELREAARAAAQELPATGLVVMADLDLSSDAERVGERLAAVASELVYGRSTIPRPVFDSFTVTRDGVNVTFTPTTAQLESPEQLVAGFVVANRYRSLAWAQGTVRGSAVALVCPKGMATTALRYGWSDVPQLGLTNEHGLPVPPFRTDEFPTLMPWDRNVVYGTVDDHDLTAMLFLPWKRHPRPWPTVVLIHGGGWRSGNPYCFTWHAHRLAKQGFAALTIRYRLSQEAPFPACLEDAKCAVRWVRAKARTYGFDPTRVAVLGQSAGAHLAALVATTAGKPGLEGNGGHQAFSSAVQAAILINGVYDFRHFWEDDSLRKFRTIRMCVPELIGKPFAEAGHLYDRASPLRHVSGGAPPCLLLHSRPDDVVPFTESVTFSDTLKQAGAQPPRLVLSDDGRHGWAMGSHLEPCYDEIESFLLDRLTSPPEE
mgnify:FL=1|jgi:sialate O-acetylesterase